MKKLSRLALSFGLFMVYCFFSISPILAMFPGEAEEGQQNRTASSPPIASHALTRQPSLPGSADDVSPTGRPPTYNLTAPPPLVIGSPHSAVHPSSPSSTPLPDLYSSGGSAFFGDGAPPQTSPKIQVSSWWCFCCWCWCCGCSCEDGEPAQKNATAELSMVRQSQPGSPLSTSPVIPINGDK